MEKMIKVKMRPAVDCIANLPEIALALDVNVAHLKGVITGRKVSLALGDKIRGRCPDLVGIMAKEVVAKVAD